jgi:hypothetical protein
MKEAKEGREGREGREGKKAKKIEVAVRMRPLIYEYEDQEAWSIN